MNTLILVPVGERSYVNPAEIAAISPAELSSGDEGCAVSLRGNSELMFLNCPVEVLVERLKNHMMPAPTEQQFEGLLLGTKLSCDTQ